MAALRQSSSPAFSLLAEIRDPALNLCLGLAAIVGPLVLIVANAPNPNFKPLHPVALAIYAIQASVIVAAIWRKGPVGFRLGALALFATLIASAALTYAGPNDGVSLLLLLCVLLGGLLFGGRGLAVVFLFVVGLFAGIGYLWVKGIFPPHEIYVYLTPHDAFYWVRAALAFVLSGGIVCGVAYYLVTRLVRFYSEERRMLQSLGEEQQLRGIAEMQKLQAELHRRYLTSTVEAITGARVEYGATYWHAETNRGSREFVTQSLQENAQWLSSEHLLLIDVDGNRFEIPNVEALDARSRAFISAIL